MGIEGSCQQDTGWGKNIQVTFSGVRALFFATDWQNLLKQKKEDWSIILQETSTTDMVHLKF